MPRPNWLFIGSLLACELFAAPSGQAADAVRVASGFDTHWTIPADSSQPFRLEAGQTFELSVRVNRPSTLPPNTRLRATWELVAADDPSLVPRGPAEGQQPAREVNAHGIYTPPTPNWSKLLHALDADLFLVYRAPVAGLYALSVKPEQGEVDLFDGQRWREPGQAPKIAPVPKQVAWPAAAKVGVSISLRSIQVPDEAVNRLFIEAEPNDTPEQAQRIAVGDVDDEYTINIVGSSDDIEYFDNGRVGSSGDDWFRFEYTGNAKRLLTGCLSIPDQQAAAQIRVYRIDPTKAAEYEQPQTTEQPALSRLLPIVEYTDGKNENERVHQQQEQHRIAITRNLEPGGVYFLRVEANAPGYDLELRVVEPAPFDNPRRAVRQGLYDHIGQVDAWLTNRPRGASVERRIRDSGNLLGTNCMSCHTQSGVWGPAIPFAMGYRPQNVQPWRHLINTCYQSLRPTNELKDAANNTSLRPLDIGDGPAGTRVAGHAVNSLERYHPARKLQGKQSYRTANYVLLTADPGGINAAGPGANVGQGVVFNYAGEIVWTAWQKTAEPRFFHALEDKARRMLDINVKYADDLGHRVEFFSRYFPQDYVAAAATAAAQDGLGGVERADALAKAKELDDRIRPQVAADLARLRAIQLEGGGWSFDPGATTDEGKTWVVKDQKAEPSPTALSLIAFQAAGVPKDDPVVAKGVQALLELQRPGGYWKGASQTGFVATSYSLHALSRYYPAKQQASSTEQFRPADNESLPATLRRVRNIAVTQSPQLTPLLIDAARDEHASVRFWAILGLGYTNTEAAIPTLITGLADRAKMVREAAHWSLRQTLIDDRGWQAILTALGSQDDYTREAAMRALVMKVDTVMPRASVNSRRLVMAFEQGLNNDPHPAVRAWATRAAWQWWVWNPPVRGGLNTAWTRLLERDEPNAIVENAIRYQSQALFIANGHVANGSKEHQYKELAELFATIHDRFQQAQAAGDDTLQRRLTQRLVAVAATFYNQRGGDGGPGQLGYTTPGAGKLFGEALMTQLAYVESLPEADLYETLMRSTLEGAANIPHEPLQEKLVNYSISGAERFRSTAASSISDPRLVSLIAVPEKLEPMYRQLVRGALEPPRRKDLSDPILKMFGGVHWILPNTEEQRLEIRQFLIPDVSQYLTAEEIATIEDAAQKPEAERNREAAWYLADGLGNAVSKNPDLHFEELAETLPAKFDNDAQARFWMRSVPWILEFKRELPEVVVDPKKLPPIDPYEELRTRALVLFLSQLKEQADPRNRKEAATLANQTALKRNPEVLTALDAMIKFEQDKGIVENAKKVLSQNSATFQKDLVAALKNDKDHMFEVDGAGNPKPPEDFVQDVTYFRDYVVPEMTKALRGDERSCMICHGEPGRVPSMELHAPDQVGFLPVDKLVANYRILQQRVNIADVETSKLLRKPLNIQTGKEDGHQGGRRYQPNDPGYQILKRWVASQVAIQEKYGQPKPSAKAKTAAGGE